MRPRLLLAAAALATGLARAQSDEAPLSFAFASQAGTGIYDLNGQIVQLYRVPVSWTARSLEKHPWGLKVYFPLTVGFVNFSAEDVVSGDFPDHVSALTFVPGVRFDVPVTRIWTVSPYAEAGVAHDFESHVGARVYALGIQSVQGFPGAGWDWRFGQRLLWAASGDGDGGGFEDEYFELELGTEARHLLPWTLGGKPTDIGGFVNYYRYFNEAEILTRSTSGVDEVDAQWEVGVTFGTRPKLAWWKVKMPKMGLSYRWGDRVSGLRFVIGEAF